MVVFVLSRVACCVLRVACPSINPHASHTSGTMCDSRNMGKMSVLFDLELRMAISAWPWPVFRLKWTKFRFVFRSKKALISVH